MSNQNEKFSNFAGIVIDEDFDLISDFDFPGDIILCDNAAIDLHGFTLTIGGSFIHISGGVTLSGGSLIVKGDYLIEIYPLSEILLSSGRLIMTDENDYVEIGGSFSTRSTSSHRLTAGVIKIGGDFTQEGHYDSFWALGSHEVIFTGDTSHKIKTSDYYCWFSGFSVQDNGRLEWQNHMVIHDLKSDLSIISNQLIIHDLNVNGHRIHIEGDVEKGSNTMTLGRGELNIDGNLLHSDGEIYFDGALLNISENYRSQKIEDDEFVSSSGRLFMRDSNDRLVIGGSFITQTYGAQHLGAGIIEIGHDFIQMEGAWDNFQAGGTLVVFKDGYKHIIQVQSRFCEFGQLLIEGDTNVVWNGYLHIRTLMSNLDIETDRLIVETFGVNDNCVTVNDDMHMHSGEMRLGVGNVLISGDLWHYFGEIYFDQGTIKVQGDYRSQHYNENENSNGRLFINDETNVFDISGNFIIQSRSDQQLHNGIIRIGRNFIQGGCRENFVALGTHVIFYGNQNHIVNIESSFFYESSI